MNAAPFRSMLTIGMSLLALSALGLVVYHLRKAPEGYEDNRGFHIAKRTAGSKVMRPGQANSSLASLRPAKANH
jgi:hypothetical protein